MHNASAHRLFSYDELKEATKDFHISALMGEGSGGKVKMEDKSLCIRRTYQFIWSIHISG